MTSIIYRIHIMLQYKFSICLHYWCFIHFNVGNTRKYGGIIVIHCSNYLHFIVKLFILYVYITLNQYLKCWGRLSSHQNVTLMLSVVVFNPCLSYTLSMSKPHITVTFRNKCRQDVQQPYIMHVHARIRHDGDIKTRLKDNQG